MAGTFVIAQGGGPTAVINQTVVGAALEIRKRHPGAKVLGSRHGVRGIRDGNYVDLSAIPEEQLRLIAGTPSAALGSTRDKPDAAYCEVILKGLQKVGADAFIYIGGNDTSGTQQILTDAAGGIDRLRPCAEDHRQRPRWKTTIRRASSRPPNSSPAPSCRVDLDFRALPGIYVGIVMGRHAGFLTAAAAAWRSTSDSGPHLIYVPERAFSVPRFIDDVRATLDRHKRCIVAVSEGVTHRRRQGAGRKPGAAGAAGARRAWQRQAVGQRPAAAPSNARWPKACRASGPASTRSATCRAAMSAPSTRSTRRRPSMPAPSRSTVAEQGGGSVALQYDGTKTVLKKVPLTNVAGKTRHMPDDFMKPDANQLSEAGMAYLKRLVPEKYKVGKPFV